MQTRLCTSTTTSRDSTSPTSTRASRRRSTTASTRSSSSDSQCYRSASRKPGEPAFALPRTHPDHGRAIAAYYYWLFPTTMFNVYPWGVSVNVVTPLAVDRTRVSFLPFVWDASKRDAGAGAGLDRVEREGQAVVA